MRRWFSALGAMVGLSLMAATVFAQGQQGAAATDTPAVDAPQGDGHGFQGRGGDGWRGRHMFMMMHPEEFCRERYARRIGFLAYLDAKLDLTAAQKPLWDKYQQASLDVAQKQRQGCLQNAGTDWRGMSVLDRRQRMEQFLKARLDGLQETDPSLQALYQALTPDQHKVLDRPFQRSEGGGR